MVVCFLRSASCKKGPRKEMLERAIKQSKDIDDFLKANPNKVEPKVEKTDPKKNKKQSSTLPDPPPAPAR